MSRVWVRLDNASNIFLAAMSDIDSKVFRLTAELDHEVDPDPLQQALDTVFDQYLLYHSVLRRGIFWYYLEESNLRPVVARDALPPCDHIYHFDRRNLLFRVVHHERRISLEVLHALTDGTGASWFLQDLVTEYVRLRHPEEFPEPVGPAGVKHGIVADSFGRFHPRQPQQFVEAARPAPLEAEQQVAPGTAPAPARPAIIGGLFRTGHRRVHRVHGMLTPDHRTRVVELVMPTSAVLPLARARGVSLTVYLTAVFLDAVRRVDADRCRGRSFAVSVPVDLRQRFESDSARNFFATTRLEYSDADGADLAAMCTSLGRQLSAQTTPAALEAKLRKLIGFEHHPIGRLLPRPLKDLVLGAVNRLNNRNLTVAMTNIGRISFPGPADDHVGAVYIQVAAARPQFGMASHGDLLTVSFTSPFTDTRHQAAFARTLTDAGVPVSVAASKVTDDELRAGAR